MRAFVVAICAAISVLTLAVLAQTPARGEQLLMNPGFEDGLTGWSSIDVALEITNQPRQGANAMLLNSPGNEQAADFFQWLSVNPDQPYDFSGYVLLDNPNVDRVFLRITWFSASSDFISSEDSPWLVGNINEYRRIATSARISPSGAAMARVSVQVTASGPFSIVADDMAFDGPAAATPTAIVSPTLPATTPTLTPRTTSSASPTDAPSSTPSRTPSPVPTLARTPTPTRIAPSATPDEPSVFTTLRNGGFEERGANGPYGWRKIGGQIEGVASPVHGGGVALAITSEGTSSTKWAYQTVAVGAGQYYEATAFAWKNGPAVDAAFLRVSWYESTGGTGEAIESVDSTETLVSNQATYRRLATGPIQAPPGARTAKVRLMMRPAGDRPATAYFDDIAFQAASAPTVAVPTRTPNPTSEPTPTPAVATSAAATASSHIPARTPSPTPTRTPTASPTPSATAVAAPEEPLVFAVLMNGGFEIARDDGTPYGWRKAGGQMAVTDDGPAEGALALELVSTSGSTKWVYQAVTVDPGQYYEATGWALTGSGASALIRVSWYSSEDGEGQALESADSVGSIGGGSGAYAYLTTEAIRAPEDARSARVRLMMRPASGERISVFFDRVAFDPVDAPPSTVGATAVPAVLGAASSPRIPRESGSQAVGAGAEQPTSLFLGGGQGSLPVPTNIHPAAQALPQGSSRSTGDGLGVEDVLLALGIGLPLAGIGGVLSLGYVGPGGRRDT